MRLHRDQKPTVVHVMGCTNAGKSTLLGVMKQRFGDRVRLVEIGKTLTAKYLDPESPHYTPDKFKGQNNPKETAGEAWDIYLQEVNRGIADNVPMILVDGQPRDVPQVEGVFEDVAPVAEVGFLLVHADHTARLNRLRHRYPKRPPGSKNFDEYKLRLRRMENDYRGNYDVLASLAARGITPSVLNTSNMPTGSDGLHVLMGCTHAVWNEFIDDS